MNSDIDLPIPYGWYTLLASDELKIGEVKPLTCFGKELVMFRTESGQAKVLDAYCPHLGAHLGYGGKVAGESIACPFHGWQFNGSGQCTAVPYAKNMPPKVAGGKQATYAYPTVERNQFIWAWYHPHRVAPSYEVEVIPECESPDWHIADKHEWTINVSMQDGAENTCDNAHFIYVHGARELPHNETVYDGITRSSNYEIPVPKLLPDGTRDPAKGKDIVYLSSISQGTGSGVQRFTGALNSLLIGYTTPLGARTQLLRFVFMEPNTINTAQKMLGEFTKAELVRQVSGDIPIWNHKRYVPTPILCDGDGPIHQFRKWYRQFYAELNSKQLERSE
jgi:3-ketosteroid 9alpha-monooxygenase subunit A